MSIPLREEFDGTWRFVNKDEPEGWNYLHFSNGNRIVQFYQIKDGTFQDARMMVSDIGESAIEFHPRDGSEGWTRKYRFDGGNLVIVEGEKEFPCERLPEIPEWLEKGIAEADLFFEENGASWGSPG